MKVELVKLEGKSNIPVPTGLEKITDFHKFVYDIYAMTGQNMQWFHSSMQCRLEWDKMPEMISNIKNRLDLYKNKTGTYHTVVKIKSSFQIGNVNDASEKVLLTHTLKYSKGTHSSLGVLIPNENIDYIVSGYENDEPVTFVFMPTSSALYVKNLQLLEEYAHFILNSKEDQNKFILSAQQE